MADDSNNIIPNIDILGWNIKHSEEFLKIINVNSKWKRKKLVTKASDAFKKLNRRTGVEASIPDSLINSTMVRGAILSNYEMRRRKQKDKSKHKSFCMQDWRKELAKVRSKHIKNELVSKVMDGCMLDLTNPFDDSNPKDIKSPSSSDGDKKLKKEERLKNIYDSISNLQNEVFNEDDLKDYKTRREQIKLIVASTLQFNDIKNQDSSNK